MGLLKLFRRGQYHSPPETLAKLSDIFECISAPSIDDEEVDLVDLSSPRSEYFDAPTDLPVDFGGFRFSPTTA